MDYIFGVVERNGVTVENLKTVGDTHTAMPCGSFTQVRREYPDCVITDLFRVDEQYGSTEAGGICYDFYAISEHWRNVDKTPALGSLKEASEIAFVTLAEAGSIDAVTAGEHKEIFGPWKTGIDYTVGQYRNYGDKLYRCIQAHTSTSTWQPSATPTLWEPIVLDHAGTQADPIPWTSGMTAHKGLYYTEGGKVYRCKRDDTGSGTALYYTIAQLVGDYFEAVTA